MARIPRNKLAPGWYHCINRGVGRQTLFFDEDDYRWMYEKLASTASQYELELRVFCLMPNHWHIVLYCSSPLQMSAFFKKVLHEHTRRHHAKYLKIGHGPIYQGRFKSFLITSEEALNEISNYVLQNPIRAGLTKCMEEWKWIWGQWKD